MANAVIPDGIEAEHPTWGIPSGGWVIGVAAVAVISLFVASGGGTQPIPIPDDTLPELEVVLDGVWDRVELPGSSPLTAVAVTRDGGYVAAGSGPQFWWSANGLSWVLGAVPEGGPRVVSDVVAHDEGLVAVGADESGAESVPAVWTARGNQTWEVQTIPLPVPSGLDGVVAADGILVAWGWAGSPADFAPGVDPLLVVSDDGSNWSPIEGPASGMRIHRVNTVDDVWYVMGTNTGQPALWRSEDLGLWEEISPASLPFGWAMVDLRDQDGSLVANLLDLGLGRTKQWRLGADGSWIDHGEEAPEGPVSIIGSADSLEGVGSGHLWTGDTEWVDAGLDGEVLDLVGEVAVGSEAGQPAVWVRGADAEPVVTVFPVSGPSWKPVAELGEGEIGGPWPVADRWVVGVGTDWWLLAGDGVTPLGDLAGTDVWRIDKVGEEWVAMPAMMWSADGLHWERRAEPWLNSSLGRGFVAAVTDIDGSALAVGLDEDRLWAVATSPDAGTTWSLVGSPVPSTPVRSVRPVPRGFVGVAARPRSIEEIAFSADGLTWETILEGQFIEAAEPPLVQTADGNLVVLDTGEVFFFPLRNVTAFARGADGALTVVADGRLAAGPAPWVEYPLDPRHGLSAADVRPLPVDGQLLVVGVDRGLVRILVWSE